MWTADLGNGRYKNPILYADYSDPDAIRVGDDYFMISSSFSNAPAMPLLHSKDLVNWKVVNYILAEIPEFRYRNPIHGCGVWAPAIRYHEGTYYGLTHAHSGMRMERHILLQELPRAVSDTRVCFIW